MAARSVLALMLVACAVACSARDGDDPGDGSVRDDGGRRVDARALPDGGGDAAAGEDAGPLADAAGPSDGGPSDAGPSDAGPADAGRADGGRDAGPPDAGRADGGRDAGASDGGGAIGAFILGAPGADCDTTCGAIGLSCGGPGTVGLDCGMHAALTGCSIPGYFIYRDHPMKPPPHCRDSWGTSEVCSNNYNVYNSFCCLCR